MTERAWFFASAGKQEGPIAEPQFREMIGSGRITAETLVWSDGMTGWVPAGSVPGLMSASAPPAMPGEAGPLVADFGAWSLVGWGLLISLATIVVIPLPWVMPAFYRWAVAHLRVPQRPNLTFTGQVGDIWWVFILSALISIGGNVGAKHAPYLPYLAILIQAALTWLVIRWVISHISSDGQPLPASFTGSVWGYIGWHIFLYVSIITIIGWAWVMTAWLRWMCRNVSGTRRPVFFNGSGWEVLWRTWVFVLTCIFIIPIPWMTRWLARWYVSQFSVGAPAPTA